MEKHGSVLIVDDEPGMCWILETALTDKGYQVTAVDTAAGAIIATENNRYDVVFIDAKLPDANGLQVAQQFSSRYPKMKLIIMSGFYSSKEDLKDTQVDYEKVAFFLGKPFDFLEIYQMLRALI
jgi:DNA-binding NtrC family response regulator